ncbi:MAG TPA: efflux transporter outer membrane subunit [Comamonas sp.]
MRNTHLSLIALAAAAALSGCSLIPQYERPQAPVPQAYAQASAAGESVAIAWRDYFTDPRLQQLIDIALANNRDMRVAALNLEQARAQFQIQRSAQFPTLGGVASATRGNNQITGDLGNTFSVGLAVSAWELDFFGRINSLKEAALAQYLASDEGRKAYELTLVTSVAQAWLSLIADEELLDISRRTVATREESIKLAKLRFDAGFASELDYRQAESLTEAAKATYAQQQRQRALDQNTLALLLGQQVPEAILASLPGTKLANVAPMADVPAGVPSDLLVRRPDIRAAEQQLIAANANIGAARAAFFPSISLTGQYGSVSNELSNLFKSGTWGFSIGPSINLPIFSAGRLTANLESAKVGREIALAQYEKSIQSGFKEVSDALASRTTLAEQARAQTAQAEAERKRFYLSDLRYRNGVASYLDLLDAQRSLFALEQADVQVRLAQLINQINLYKALGGGWSEASLGKQEVSNR